MYDVGGPFHWGQVEREVQYSCSSHSCVAVPVFIDWLLLDYIFIPGWLIASARHPDGGSPVYEYRGLMMNVANIVHW